jgi:glycosyltransferase involved in cell wall biosynthesis
MARGPLVSVVMPSLNQAAFICAAIDSVLGQNYGQTELIVVDGGSTDGTQALLAARQAQDGRLRWQSVPDTGPAQAINAAIKLARGTVVGWLNSDDLYTPGAIQRAIAALQANPKWLMAYGHGMHVDGLGRPLHPYPTLPPATPVSQFAEGCFICQPTVFARRTFWQLLGPLDETLKAAFDFDYWLRAFATLPGRMGFVDAVQAYSRLHAGCITVRMRRTVALEGMQVLARHLGQAPKEWLLTYFNELLAASDHADMGAIRAQANEALAVAAPWLGKDDLPKLKIVLDELLK